MRRYFFVHIPKTAGTSFGAMLKQLFGEEAVCPFISPGFAGEMPDLERYTAFHGHCCYFVYRFLPQPVEILTIFRDPIKRAISNYEHIRDDAGHPDHELLIRETRCLGDFARHPLLSGHCNNVQSRLIGKRLKFKCGDLPSTEKDEVRDSTRMFVSSIQGPRRDHIDLPTAMERVREMRFFGLTEDFDLSCRMFFATYGLPMIESARLNRAAERPKHRWEQYSSDDLTAVRAVNDCDIQLYAYAKALFARRARLFQISSPLYVMAMWDARVKRLMRLDLQPPAPQPAVETAAPLTRGSFVGAATAAHAVESLFDAPIRDGAYEGESHTLSLMSGETHMLSAEALQSLLSDE